MAPEDGAAVDHDEICVLAATPRETGELIGALQERVEQRHAGRRWVAGMLACRPVLVVEGGTGAVNTAQALTCVLETRRPVLVVQIGVGGAYPAAGLALGDLALATEENYGDLGLRTPAGWRPARFLGAPVLERDGLEYYNRFTVDEDALRQARRLLRSYPWDAAVGLEVGPFVTVQECSGTESLATERGLGFGAICESMEGAAAAHLACLYDVPFLELRGISHQVQDSRLDLWDLPLAASRAQRATLRLLLDLVC